MWTGFVFCNVFHGHCTCTQELAMLPGDASCADGGRRYPERETCEKECML